MTKRDFLNALVNPTHADIKIKLRTLRKELRAYNWKLKYRYCKKSHTFYMTIWPTAVSKGSIAISMRLLEPLNKVRNSDMDMSINERTGHIFADIYVIQSKGFIV